MILQYIVCIVYASQGNQVHCALAPNILLAPFYLFFLHVYQSPQPFPIEFHQILALALSYDINIQPSLKDDQSRSARLKREHQIEVLIFLALIWWKCYSMILQYVCIVYAPLRNKVTRDRYCIQPNSLAVMVFSNSLSIPVLSHFRQNFIKFQLQLYLFWIFYNLSGLPEHIGKDISTSPD